MKDWNCQIRLVLLCISCNFLLGNLYGQDPQFSQFYANSMYLNPALTGNTAQLRMASTYRNQWPSIPKGYVSYTAALDYNFEKIKSGVGFLATHDKAGNEGLQFTNLALLYSHYVRLNKTTYLRGGVKMSYTSRSVNQSELLFSDQIIRDGAPFSIEEIGNSINHFDFGTGILLSNSEKYWLGVSVNHINQPVYSFLGNSSFLPIKTSVHGGWNFALENNGNITKPQSIKTIVHYKSQGRWDQVDVGAYYEKDPYFIGLWYRGIPFFKKFENEFPNNESMVLIVGVKANDLKIGYSYDVTISKLARNSGGAHEISIIYEVANYSKKKKRRRYFLAPCPKF